jgi:DNA-binding transcriptional LysR family regulator
MPGPAAEKGMNLRQIEAFRAVMLSGSMTAAARDLHTSQPNISRLIAQLEGDTSLKLFERTGAHLVPTSEGNAFFSEVERAFVGLKSLANTAANIRDLGTGRIRIAAVPSMGMTFLPRVIQQFKKKRPDVTVSLHVNTSSTVVHWANSQFCDLGFAVYVGDGASAEIELLSEVAAVCVVPRGHRIGTLEVAAPADFAGEPFISLCHGDGTREKMDRAFERTDVARVQVIEAQYSAICCEMVALGLGVTLAHPLIAQDFLHRPVEIRPFAPPVLFPVYLVYPPHQPKALLMLEFVAMARQCYAEEVAAATRMMARSG